MTIDDPGKILLQEIRGTIDSLKQSVTPIFDADEKSSEEKMVPYYLFPSVVPSNDDLRDPFDMPAGRAVTLSRAHSAAFGLPFFV